MHYENSNRKRTVRHAFISLAALAIALICAIVPSALPDKAETAAAATYVYTFTSDKPIDFSSIIFSIKGNETKHLEKGASKKLKLKNSPGKVKWSSSNKKVASVSKSGVVKAKKAGKATITVKSTTTGFSTQCTIKVYAKRTQAQAKKDILSLRSKYYEGRRWTNEDHYFWEAAGADCFGCIAFAGIASDKAFGKYAPLKTHSNFNKIKIGDHVRIGNWHSVIVLEKRDDSIVVAEGNYNLTMHWGRVITRDELAAEGYVIWTRY